MLLIGQHVTNDWVCGTLLDFVTVVYSRDYPLLELQARSFERFVDPALVSAIHIVLNDRHEAALRRSLEPILAAYGALRPRVNVVSGDDLLLGPSAGHPGSLRDRVLIENRYRLPFIRKSGWRGNNGYRMQQVLKLGAARVAGTDRMVILDAKNLFLRPVSYSDFFAESGAARVRFIPVESDFHRNWLRESLDVLDVRQPDFSLIRTTTFSTPFPVRRSLVLALLEDINRRYGSVQALFASRRRPSEFMLLNALCMKGGDGYGPWFEPSDPLNIGLWPAYAPEQLAELVSQLGDPSALSLGLHNRDIAKLAPELRARLFDALARRGICDRKTAEHVLETTTRLSV